MNNPDPQSKPQYASAKHRLIAMVYDGLLLITILFIAIAIFTPIAAALGFDGEHPAFTVYFLSICFLFYAGFWTHGGQTLGMTTWKIKLTHENGQPISWSQALLRYMTAMPSWFIIIIGTSVFVVDTLNLPKPLYWINDLPDGLLLAVGLLMLYFDQRPNNWRDRFSHTQIIRLNESDQ